MKRCAAVLTAIAALGGAASLHAASWPMSGHDAHNRSFAAGERAIGRQNLGTLHVVWTATGPTQTVAAGGRVFTALSAGRGLAVFDGRNGRRLRHVSNRQLGISPRDNIATLAYGRGILLVASSLQLIALDPTTGRIRWRRTGGATSVVVTGGTVYTGQGCQSPCGAPASEALDLGTGRIRWRHAGNFGGRPVLIGGLLYQSSGEISGVTRVYAPASGALIRSIGSFGQWTGNRQGAYVEVALAIGSHASAARFRRNGSVAWRVRLGSPLGSPAPALAYAHLFLASNRSHPGIIALDTANGRAAWGSDVGPVSSVIVANHLVFAVAGLGLDVLDAGSGRLLRRLTLPPAIGADANLLLSGGILYATGAGGVSAVSPIG